MLGFTPISAAALSATGKTEALVVLVAATFSTATGTLVSEGKASNLFDTTIVSSVAGQIDFDAKASLDIAATLASITINDVAEVTGKASNVPTGVVASGAGGQLDFDAKANLTTASAQSSIVNAVFEDVDAQATTTLVAATFTASAGTVNDLEAKASIVPTGAASQGLGGQLDFDAKSNFDLAGIGFATSVGFVDPDAQATANSGTTPAETFPGLLVTSGVANVVPPSVEATGVGGQLDSDAKANFTISGAFVSTGTNLLDFSAQADTTITTAGLLELTTIDLPIVAGSRADITDVPRLITVSGNVSAEGVLFNFEQFADSYDTSRVIYILGTPADNTVYVTQENATVVTHNTNRKQQVEATAIHNVVYIRPDKTNRTVYITR